VRPIAIRHIGKESNRWEEQFYLGGNEGADIDYGTAPDIEKALLDQLRAQIIAIGQRKVSRKSGVSRRTIERLLRGEKIRTDTLTRIRQAL
jgi:DNA-binding Xre family transcriptional regulator